VNVGIPVQLKELPKPPIESSPALSMDKPAPSIKGRKIAILAGDGLDSAQFTQIHKKLTSLEAQVHVLAIHGGEISATDGQKITVKFPFTNAPSVFYDSVIVPESESLQKLLECGLVMRFISQSYVHCKTIGAIGEGTKIVQNALQSSGISPQIKQPGVLVGTKASVESFLQQFVESMKIRHFDRKTHLVQFYE